MKAIAWICALAFFFPSPASADHAPATYMDAATLDFDRVEPWPSGFIKVVRLDGNVQFIGAQRVRWIRDVEGRDWTSRVLDDRRVLYAGTLAMHAGSRRPDFRGRPKPWRAIFPIFQSGVLARIGPRDGLRGQERAIGVLDFGAMRNLGEHYALGASFHVAEGEKTRLGAKIRVRRWFGSLISIDAAPGVLFRGASNGDWPGLVGELGLSIGDLVYLTGQVEASRPSQSPAVHRIMYWPYPPPAPETEFSWYVGGKVGGELGIGITIGALVVAGLLNE